MKDQLSQDFERFVNRGTARGARATFDAAAGGSSYLAERDGRAGHAGNAWRIAAAVPALVLLVVIGFAIASNRSGVDEGETSAASGEAPGGPPSTAAPAISSAPGDTAVDPAIAAQMEQGWAPMSSTVIPIGEGTQVPKGAWVPFNPDLATNLDERGRLPVYDQPNGQVIGYLFDVGYAPADLANAPGFDIDSIRTSMGVCPRGDNPCTRAQIEELTEDFQGRDR